MIIDPSNSHLDIVIVGYESSNTGISFLAHIQK